MKNAMRKTPTFSLEKNYLLVTKDGTIGKVAIVYDMPKPATLNSGVFVTRPLKAQYRQDFLYWVLVSDVFPEFIAFSMVGTTINHLYQKTFERFVYPLPPLRVQQHIATYLDASCAAIDAAVVAKRRQLKTLDELRRGIIQDSVTKGLDPNVRTAPGIDWLPRIPKHWGVAKLKRHTRIIRGQFSHRPRNDPAFYDHTPSFKPGVSQQRKNSSPSSPKPLMKTDSASQSCFLPTLSL